EESRRRSSPGLKAGVSAPQYTDEHPHVVGHSLGGRADTLAWCRGAGLIITALSSVMAGAIFGDHCSPISDTTVLSSIFSGSGHIDHGRTQMPYALVVMGVAWLLGDVATCFGLGGFGFGWWVLGLIVHWVGKPVPSVVSIVMGEPQTPQERG
ncbi:MAG: hypothetical protein C4337_09705, partial [Armatimonadota bacterium]